MLQLADIVLCGEDLRRWLLQTTIHLHGADGVGRDLELRVPCCVDMNVEGDKFCQSSDLLPQDCARFKAYLMGVQQGNVACLCRQTSTMPPPVLLKRLPFNVQHADSSRPRFDLDMGSCASFAALYTQEVLDVEASHAMDSLLAMSPHAAYPLLALQNVLDHVRSDLSSERHRINQAATTIHALHRQQTSDTYALAQSRATATHPPSILDRRASKAPTVAKGTKKKVESCALLTSSAATSDQCKTRATTRRMRPGVPIPRFDMRTFTHDEYMALANKSAPFILTHATDVHGAPGVPPWSLSMLNATCGLQQTILKHKSASYNRWAGMDAIAQVPLHAYLDAIHQSVPSPWPHGLSDLYLHDVSVASFCPALLDSFVIPKVFAMDALQTTCTKNAAYWPSLFIGDQHTASGLHVDWGSSAAWMGLLQGRKRWRIASPSQRPFLYERIADTERGKFDADLFAPDLEKYPLLAYVDMYDDVLGEGEVMYIPADCPHQVENLDLTMAVAMNIVDHANLHLHAAYVDRQMKFVEAASPFVAAEYARMLAALEAMPPVTDATTMKDMPFAAFKAAMFDCDRLGAAI
ncbi:Aste57867_18119 [Aphanomyces stellatus]|uniref:Aste57867_18119 protein n=1 Tax=Aphanomyces stellatus TaxID=120398 RepID=A0A485L9H8_9STRA|nr:hypothetical protein As57867_018057 [Aphanomyces stellatus]VFT94857.1 Aste57867_18119 [Aphanomyces stellatus]